MSKLTDILDSFQREQELKDRRTVAQFAAELNKPASLLLEQFAEAGVLFSAPDDVVSPSHKTRLLEWLKSQLPARSEKKITIRRSPGYSPFGLTWRAVAAGENGAEWECLSQFAAEVILGHEIHPDQQRLINLIVAKVMIQELLPLKRVGRPKESRTDELAQQVSYAYWDLVDSGYPSEEAVGILSSRFHKTERQIYRYVQSQRNMIGLTKEDRERRRSIFQLPIYVYGEGPPHGMSYQIPRADLSSLTDQDYLDHIDELIVTEAKRFPDINEHVFIDSDFEE